MGWVQMGTHWLSLGVRMADSISLSLPFTIVLSLLLWWSLGVKDTNVTTNYPVWNPTELIKCNTMLPYYDLKVYDSSPEQVHAYLSKNYSAVLLISIREVWTFGEKNFITLHNLLAIFITLIRKISMLFLVYTLLIG